MPIKDSRYRPPDDDFHKALLGQVPRLRLYARALTGNMAAADDLVQDSLLRAIEKHHLWQRGTNLAAWLTTIMRHQFIDGCRSRRTISFTELIEDRMESLAAPAGQLLHMELERTGDAIDRLPVDYREVLILVAIEGMSYEEAAVLQGVPVGTIRSRLSRARAALRQSLQSRRAYRPKSARAAPGRPARC
jgi:RNA polymerase sigma-70 factor (ECF subfamily)